MKVPKYIENKMRRAHRHFQAGSALMDDVNEWLEAHGFDILELRNGDGMSLEEIEYGSEGAVDHFLEKLKKMNGGSSNV